MRWEGHVTYAFCNHDRVYELKGKFKGYKCSLCKRKFSVIKGRIFEKSQIPLQKWFTAIYSLITRKKGISAMQLSRDIGVVYNTAHFMLQRIRTMLRYDATDKLSGLVEMDETMVGGKNKNRHWDKTHRLV